MTRLTRSTVCAIFASAMLPATAAPTHLEKQTPASISTPAPGVVLIDFSRVAFANLELVIPDGAEKPIHIHFGEALKNGRIDRKPPGTVRYNRTTINPKGKRRVIAAPPPDARNTEFGPATSRKHPPAIPTPKEWGVILPFRWVEIEGWPGILRTDQITRRAAFLTAWDDSAASFECSDTTLNAIWELCRYSIKATTFAGIYVDGDRERIPYEADAYLNQLSHYYTDHDLQMARDTIDHLMVHGTWPSEWAPHMVFMVFADYMHSGDKDWMAGRYEALKSKTLAHRRGGDGLIVSEAQDIKRTDIVDWPKQERDDYVFTARNTVVNAFHLEALHLMERIASELGHESDAREFREMFANSHAVFQKTFFNETRNLYVDGIGTDHSSLHANLFPLAFDLEPPGKGAHIAQWLAGRGMRCSVYAAQYFMEALLENGQSAAALKLMTADGDRSWKHMLNSGTTITWEAWDQKYKPNQDWNHAWGAAPANLLPRYVLGAEPLSPGWKLTLIRPQTGDLNFAKGTIPTPLGALRIDWNKGEDFVISVSLPDGASAKLDLPASRNSSKVLVDGVQVEAKKNVERWQLKKALSGKFKVTQE